MACRLRGRVTSARQAEKCLHALLLVSATLSLGIGLPLGAPVGRWAVWLDEAVRADMASEPFHFCHR